MDTKKGFGKPHPRRQEGQGRMTDAGGGRAEGGGRRKAGGGRRGRSGQEKDEKLIFVPPLLDGEVLVLINHRDPACSRPPPPTNNHPSNQQPNQPTTLQPINQPQLNQQQPIPTNLPTNPDIPVALPVAICGAWAALLGSAPSA